MQSCVEVEFFRRADHQGIQSYRGAQFVLKSLNCVWVLVGPGVKGRGESIPVIVGVEGVPVFEVKSNDCGFGGSTSCS